MKANKMKAKNRIGLVGSFQISLEKMSRSGILNPEKIEIAEKKSKTGTGNMNIWYIHTGIYPHLKVYNNKIQLKV